MSQKTGSLKKIVSHTFPSDVFNPSMLNVTKHLLSSHLLKKNSTNTQNWDNENVILWLISVVPFIWNFVIRCSYLQQCG